MSGGRYAPWKTPERACAKPANWPAADRALWDAARAPADPLDPDGSLGSRHDYSPRSNQKIEQGYGRWITDLEQNNPDALQLDPAERIIPDRVSAYLGRLQSLGNSTQTCLSRLQDLHDMAKVLAPHKDWGFFSHFASRIRRHHRPARSKLHLRLSDELLDLGLSLMKEAQHQTTQRKAAILYRDGLIIAVQALFANRRRNLASIQIDKNLIATGEAYLLRFEEDETKTGQFLEFECPVELSLAIVVYLTTYRPTLAQLRGRWSKPVGDALWVSSDGSPMTEMALYDVVRKRTKAAFGQPMSIHLCRDAAATTLAIADPENVRVASSLLGHRNLATTERYYQQANKQIAHREFVATLFPKGGSDEQE
jgi:integrase/recombinase XerD